MPLLKHILLQGHQCGHYAVLVESAKGDVLTDLVIEVLLCQAFHFLLGILRDVLATDGLLDCLEQEPIRAVSGGMDDEIAPSGLRTRVLSLVWHAFGPRGNSKNALGADGNSWIPMLVGKSARLRDAAVTNLSVHQVGNSPGSVGVRCATSRLAQRCGCRLRRLLYHPRTGHRLR